MFKYEWRGFKAVSRAYNNEGDYWFLFHLNSESRARGIDKYAPVSAFEWFVGKNKETRFDEQPVFFSAAERDWEREAKKKVRIEMDDPMRRRKTIYHLESYASYGSSDSPMGDMLRYSIMGVPDEPAPPRIRYSVSMVNILSLRDSSLYYFPNCGRS